MNELRETIYIRDFLAQSSEDEPTFEQALIGWERDARQYVADAGKALDRIRWYVSRHDTPETQAALDRACGQQKTIAYCYSMLTAAANGGSLVMHSAFKTLLEAGRVSRFITQNEQEVKALVEAATPYDFSECGF